MKINPRSVKINACVLWKLIRALFRATKNCVVICRASLLYEMGYPIRSTVIVPMEFCNIFRPNLSRFFLEKSCSNLVNQYQPTRSPQTKEVSNNFSATTSYCLWPPLSRGFSLLFVNYDHWSLVGTLSAWSWFSIRVERVGVAPSGWGARAARIRSWSVTAIRRTASLRAL